MKGFCVDLVFLYLSAVCVTMLSVYSESLYLLSVLVFFHFFPGVFCLLSVLSVFIDFLSVGVI